MYIYLANAREGFIADCRRINDINGSFLTGLLKGRMLEAVGRDQNNQMFPIA